MERSGADHHALRRASVALGTGELSRLDGATPGDHRRRPVPRFFPRARRCHGGRRETPRGQRSMSKPVPAVSGPLDPRALAGQSEDALRATIAERDKVIAALNAELAATNQGVVALYAELDDRAEQLGQATELKSKFLSYMSHEFRLPLSSIISITRLLLQRLDGPLTPEQERQVAFIRGSANELSTMVNDLLDLAKIEAGRITISPAWFEMVDLFSALRGIFKPILVSDKVSLIFEEPEGLSRIYT